MCAAKIDKPIPYYLQLYREIKQRIYDRTYRAGDRINESQLSKEMGISRSPIREAMRLLEKDGLLIADEKLGFVVYSLTVTDVEHIYELRIALEVLAVELAVQHASEQELEVVSDILDEVDRLIRDKADDERIIDWNQKFHQEIAQCSHNPYLARQLSTIEALIFYCRVMNFEGRGRATHIQNEHRQIFKALKERDAQTASAMMEKHLKHDLEHLHEVLTS
ncbi:GntR family transcriptional regulator [Geomicrobium sediminis]|uniref:DNA-binding GntR family transcriptional regulator n=1 Tax=Geomicrobium sediminis TaxID=1347788 RepID=A0ABS2PI88_9BACL|nr:GntR family transcriptional regulator [Geomicrobium sediminis]MBM7635150.1 DNA-binding GntR family transcriptional regulator [Geomicrobium sediminis]